MVSLLTDNDLEPHLEKMQGLSHTLILLENAIKTQLKIHRKIQESEKAPKTAKTQPQMMKNIESWEKNS